MAIINAAQAAVKTVADPNASYESLKSLWNKSRAVCSGERFVKDFDGLIDVQKFISSIDLTSQNQIMSPGKSAMLLSNQFSTIFSELKQ